MLFKARTQKPKMDIVRVFLEKTTPLSLWIAHNSSVKLENFGSREAKVITLMGSKVQLTEAQDLSIKPPDSHFTVQCGFKPREILQVVIGTRVVRNKYLCPNCLKNTGSHSRGSTGIPIEYTRSCGSCGNTWKEESH